MPVDALLLTRPKGESLEFLVPTQQNIKIHISGNGEILIEDMNFGRDIVALVQNVK